MTKPQRCLVCKEVFQEGHFFYRLLCRNCGELNYAKRSQTADLKGKIALVTGARVKIGYAVALRLLRGGAKVIATTRFPRDAARRYARESDFSEFRDRLEIYPLDLRHLATVESFAQHLIYFYPRLDIIINNAAQTVRRPQAFYQHLIPFESLPAEKLPPELKQLLPTWPAIESGNSAQLPQPVQLLGETNEAIIDTAIDGAIESPDSDRDNNSDREKTENSALAFDRAIAQHSGEDSQEGEALFPLGMYDSDGQQIDLRTFNSWLMKDGQVSIMELLEVHVINAIAPFVLNSRLKSLMQKPPEEPKYIINVSSMEGKFSGSNKPWRHPHTNMAKASLNQMTRTCAQEYAKYGIFMNGVDPGWISFQHPYHTVVKMRDRGVEPPFDLADAAARICDPIYQGINEKRYPFGKLFKDYAESPW